MKKFYLHKFLATPSCLSIFWHYEHGSCSELIPVMDDGLCPGIFPRLVLIAFAITGSTRDCSARRRIRKINTRKLIEKR